MRTKVLLGAAALAASASFAVAQNVYSLNVVGYINLNLTNGYNLVANQLDLDGTMTNNTIQSVFGTNGAVIPNLTKVSFYDAQNTIFNTATFSATSQRWNNAAANPGLKPGQGVFVQIPGTSGTSVPITMVGQVIQGTNPVTMYPALQLMSIIPPISVGVQTVMGIPAARLDKIQEYVPGGNNTGFFVGHTYNGTTWSGGEPTPAVGEAFYYVPTLNVTTNRTWTQVFNVQ